MNRSWARMVFSALPIAVILVVSGPASAEGEPEPEVTVDNPPPPVVVIDDQPAPGLTNDETRDPTDTTTSLDPEAEFSNPPREPELPTIPSVDFAVPQIEGASESLARVLPQLDAEGVTSVAAQLNTDVAGVLAKSKEPGLRMDPTGVVLYEEPPVLSPRLATTALGPYPTSETFSLHSRPGASKVIFLDFDGHTVSGTAWAGGSTITVEPWYGTSIDQSEHNFIQDVWARVAEDFAPFDVDVTTEDPGFAAIDRSNAADSTYGSRVIVTPGPWSEYNVCSSACGGVAYVGTFDWFGGAGHAYYQPAWVHGGSLGQDAKNIAEASSHEAGHNLGLSHDGQGGTGYYAGHSMWAPTMGNSYNRPVSQWSKGDYEGANQTQDDFLVMQANGLNFRADDHTDSFSPSAEALTIPVEVDAEPASGVITTQSDVDTFGFVGDCASGAAVTFTASNAPSGPNLDVQLQLFSATGTPLALANPEAAYSSRDLATGMDAALSYPVADGETVYLQVDGVGVGNASTGYTDWASLGGFSLSVSEPTPVNDEFPGTQLSSMNSPFTGALSVGGTNCGATRTDSEPDSSGGTVWYNWTAPTTGKVFVTTCDTATNFDTFVQVYTGTVEDALTVVASNQDASSAWCDDTTQSRIVSMAVTEGQNYKIRVRGWNGDKGEFKLTIKYHWCIAGNQTFTPTIIGSPLAETLIGTADQDTILAYGGDDVIDGLGGDDRLCGGFGDDTIYGRAGSDLLSGGVGNDTIVGHQGDDVIYGGSGDDLLEGFAGDDVIYGQNGDDVMYGFTGDDQMFGGSGIDRISGQAGADQLFGHSGDDLLWGGGGNDQLYGGNGSDSLYGQGHTDLCFGGPGTPDVAFGCETTASVP